MIVLDTNVLSEAMRPDPAKTVAEWMRRNPVSTLFTTTITQAEILYGIQLLPRGKRRTALLGAWQSLQEELEPRILPFDTVAAMAFPEIALARRIAARPIPPFDAQIAAIVRANGATLATRNINDFEGCGIAVLNPWE